MSLVCCGPTSRISSDQAAHLDADGSTVRRTSTGHSFRRCQQSQPCNGVLLLIVGTFKKQQYTLASATKSAHGIAPNHQRSIPDQRRPSVYLMLPPRRLLCRSVDRIISSASSSYTSCHASATAFVHLSPSVSDRVDIMAWPRYG
jgi:hypothetical protein